MSNDQSEIAHCRLDDLPEFPLNVLNCLINQTCALQYHKLSHVVKDVTRQGLEQVSWH